MWGKWRQWCSPQAPILFPCPPGSQQLACSLGLACHIASRICDVLMCTMTAGLTAKPRREDLGKSGDLCDLGQIIQATPLARCPC